MIDLLQGQEAIPDTPTYVMITIVNRNPFVIRDRYDGVPIEFPPGERINITKDQALHFFGFPGTADEMAVHMAKRFGWNTADYVKRERGSSPDEPMLFQKYAAAVHLEVVEMELVPKQKNAADDNLDIETMPSMADMAPEGPPSHPDDRERSARVGIRKDSPTKNHRIGGRGRPRKDPGFVPLG